MVCIEFPYGLIYKKNFKFLGRTVSDKSAMLFSSYYHIFLENCSTEEHEIWFQVIIRFFSKTVQPRNMKFGLHRVSIFVNIQNKFQVPRLHSIREKCDANFKLSSHFSPKLFNRGT